MFDMECFSEIITFSALAVLDQCMYNARTTKPTMFLCDGIDMMHLALKCDHGPAAHPQCVQLRDNSGGFATQSLSKYPLLLNQNLAYAIREAVEAVGGGEVVILFSGEDDREDGLPVFLRKLGYMVHTFDLVNTHLPGQDVANDADWANIRDTLSSGQIACLVAAPPCRTYSLARTVRGGPPPVRSREFPEGFPPDVAEAKSIPSSCMAKVANDNILAKRTADAVTIMKSLGKAYMVEQPWPWKDEAPDSRDFAIKGAGYYTIKGVEDASLHDLQAHLAEMILTGKERYNRVAVVGSEYSNGFSEMLGLAVHCRSVTKATVRNPGLFELCMAWFRKQPKAASFDVTSVQVNHNMLARAHRDSANAGYSALIAFGLFTGGDLLYWPLDTGGPIQSVLDSVSQVSLDATTLQFFDGRCLHATAPFLGERYSLVFFCVIGAESVPVSVQRQLVEMGASHRDWQVQRA